MSKNSIGRYEYKITEDGQETKTEEAHSFKKMLKKLDKTKCYVIEYKKKKKNNLKVRFDKGKTWQLHHQI